MKESMMLMLFVVFSNIVIISNKNATEYGRFTENILSTY